MKDIFGDLAILTLKYLRYVYILENQPFIWLLSPNHQYHKLPFKLASRIHRKQGWEYIYETEPRLNRWQGLKRFFTG
jgi:hypothetical protein